MRLSQVVALLASSSTANKPILLLAMIVALLLPAAAQVREFQSPLTVPLGQPVLSTASADLNHDNHADIVATMKTSVAVILGDGQGRFRTIATYTLANSTGGGIQTVIADFNNDGNPDLAVLTGHGYSMLFGNGDGSFTQPVNYTNPGNEQPLSMATGDFNGDHLPDLAIGGSCSGNCNAILVLLNNGDGTFTPRPNMSVLGVPLFLQVGDLNNDGKQDLVAAVAGWLHGNLAVFVGNGDGTFRGPSYFGAGETQPTSMILADLNNDGNLDIVYAVSPGDGSGLYVLLGNGKNNFQQVYGQSMSPYAASVAATDINHDGKLDVIVLNAASDIEVLLGKGDGTLIPPTTYRADAGVFGISLSDFNEDGNVDFASADNHNSSVDVVFGSGKGLLQAATVNIVPSDEQAAGDLNGDGKADIVIAEGDAIQVFRGNGDGSFTPGGTFADDADRVMVLADVNGDAKLDLVGVNSSGIVGVLLGNGDGTFQGEVKYSTEPKANQLRVADVNNDGKMDIVTASGDTEDVSVLLGNGNGTFQSPKNSPVGVVVSDFALGNFNADKQLDLVLMSGYPDNKAEILLGRGDGTFGPPTVLAVQPSLTGIQVGDFNDDHNLDIAVVDVSETGVDILHGNGDGSFQTAQTYTIAYGGISQLQVADFNGDGRLDIALGGNAAEVWVLLGAQIGFTTPSPYAFPSDGASVEALMVADFNGDGALDIAQSSANVDRQQDYVTVLLNLGGTHVGLTSSQNPSKSGQPVTFTATVQASVPTVPIPSPSGSVSFLDGKTVLGTVPLSSGQAQFTTSTLSVGTHSIRALYNGDKNYVRTMSAVLKQVVQP